MPGCIFVLVCVNGAYQESFSTQEETLIVNTTGCLKRLSKFLVKGELRFQKQLKYSRERDGNGWESNPPRLATRPDTGVEDREAHQDLTIPVIKDIYPPIDCQLF